MIQIKKCRDPDHCVTTTTTHQQHLTFNEDFCCIPLQDGQSGTAMRRDRGESQENNVCYIHRSKRKETLHITQDHREKHQGSQEAEDRKGKHLGHGPYWGFHRKGKEELVTV